MDVDISPFSRGGLFLGSILGGVCDLFVIFVLVLPDEAIGEILHFWGLVYTDTSILVYVSSLFGRSQVYFVKIDSCSGVCKFRRNFAVTFYE